MRRNRVVLPDCPHHVVHRGNNRRRLFSYPRDYRRFLGLLWAAADKTECGVHVVCLMANHVHLIVTPTCRQALSEFVQRFAQRYAQLRNEERSASGKLFEERYWSEPIRTVLHLAAATMYIDNNPVAGGVKSSPELHRWSSYRLHAGVGTPEKGIGGLCTPTDWYVSLGPTARARQDEYGRLFRLYATTELARAQERFFHRQEHGASRYTRRLERPDRTSARERNGLSRYGEIPR